MSVDIEQRNCRKKKKSVFLLTIQCTCKGFSSSSMKGFSFEVRMEISLSVFSFSRSFFKKCHSKLAMRHCEFSLNEKNKCAKKYLSKLPQNELSTNHFLSLCSFTSHFFLTYFISDEMQAQHEQDDL